MKLEMNAGVGRGLPLALIVTLVLQCGGAIWWLSARARDAVFMEQRVERLESVAAQTSQAHEQTSERLARIEERITAQTATLSHIEKLVSSH